MTDWPDDVAFVDQNGLDWIAKRLRPGRSITSFVPTGFEVYVRVLHPAARRDADTGEWRVARWKEVSEWAGTDLRPDSLFGKLGGPSVGTHGFPFDYPYEGFLDDETCYPLVESLSSKTSTPNDCRFALWEGSIGVAESIGMIRSATLKGRYYIVVAGVADLACRLPLTASYWWPADKAWVVVTGLDWNWTIVGCDSTTARLVIADDRLEAFEIAPDSILMEHRGGH